jgi:hypothetical protein
MNHINGPVGLGGWGISVALTPILWGLCLARDTGGPSKRERPPSRVRRQGDSPASCGSPDRVLAVVADDLIAGEKVRILQNCMCGDNSIKRITGPADRERIDDSRAGTCFVDHHAELLFQRLHDNTGVNGNLSQIPQVLQLQYYHR